MATLNKFNSFVEALAEKVHNLGSDQLMVALTNAANPPVSGNAILTDLVEITDYTGLSTRVLTQTGSEQSGGVYQLSIADLTLTASATVPAFRYGVIYNNSATNKELIGWVDRGSEVVLNENDTFTFDFDDANGILKIQ